MCNVLIRTVVAALSAGTVSAASAGATPPAANGQADSIIVFGLRPRILGQWAPPFTFGPGQVVASNIGRVGFEIELDPLGSGVIVIGEVTYVDESGHTRSVQFQKSIHIQTGNVVSNVTLRLKTVGPTGSAVHVTITP